MTKPLEALIAEMKAAANKARQANELYLEKKITLSECAIEIKDYLEYSDDPKNILALIAALEQAQQDHRLHVARLLSERGQLKDRIAELEAKRKPVMFIDGDVSTSDAEKLANVIREWDTEGQVGKLDVKLPAERFCPSEYAGSQLWSETEVWNNAISACAEAIRAAGGTVGGE